MPITVKIVNTNTRHIQLMAISPDPMGSILIRAGDKMPYRMPIRIAPNTDAITLLPRDAPPAPRVIMDPKNRGNSTARGQISLRFGSVLKRAT